MSKAEGNSFAKNNKYKNDLKHNFPHPWHMQHKNANTKGFRDLTQFYIASLICILLLTINLLAQSLCILKL